MTIDRDFVGWHRYYNEPPENKSIAQCYYHGLDHLSYGWNPQIDPRWSTEQKEAYLSGYGYSHVS